VKTLETMTRDEKNLLLYFETCAVDHTGKVNVIKMNADDKKIAENWNKEGFCQFGRIAFEDVNVHGCHWCSLSKDAWKLASEERKSRAQRTWSQRTWQTTEEKRATT
jgi:hypothetical protein